MDNKFYTVFVNFVPPLKINYLKNSGIENVTNLQS